jgi:predicted transcriptional regulator
MGSVIMLTAYAITSGVKEVKKRRKQRKAKKEGLAAADDGYIVDDTAVSFRTNHRMFFAWHIMNVYVAELT